MCVFWHSQTNHCFYVLYVLNTVLKTLMMCVGVILVLKALKM